MSTFCRCGSVSTSVHTSCSNLYSMSLMLSWRAFTNPPRLQFRAWVVSKSAPHRMDILMAGFGFAWNNAGKVSPGIPPLVQIVAIGRAPSQLEALGSDACSRDRCSSVVCLLLMLLARFVSLLSPLLLSSFDLHILSVGRAVRSTE